MTIILISLIWLTALAALVLRLAARPQRAPVSLERSPKLLEDKRPDFERPIGEDRRPDFERPIGEVLASSKPATAQDVRDRAQKDLYVRP
jgi:hypothetical protein